MSGKNGGGVKIPFDFQSLFQDLSNDYEIFPIHYIDKFESVATQADVDILNRYISKICKWTLTRDHGKNDDRIQRNEIKMCDYIKRTVERYFKI